MSFSKTLWYILGIVGIGCAVTLYQIHLAPQPLVLAPDLALSSPSPPHASSRPSLVVMVHIAGAVASPGVYRVDPSLRVLDAIELAGGVVDSADLDRVNLVRKVKDGLRIYVPFVKQRKRASSSTRFSNSSRLSRVTQTVSLNRATQKEFEQLPGIGPSIASRIVRYRDHHGDFKSIEDLEKVKGIGPKLLNRLRSRIRLD